MSPLISNNEWEDPQHPVTGPPSNKSLISFIAIHYPGVPNGALKLDQPKQVMLNTDIFYRTKGYSFGYNFATFPSGRYEGRGFDIRNAANVADDDGISDNPLSLSVNIMVNGQDKATPTQVEFTRDMIQHIWDWKGVPIPLVGHGKIPGAATPCPGLGISAQLAQNVFLPQPSPLKKDPGMFLIKKLDGTEDNVYGVIDTPKERFRIHIKAADFNDVNAKYGPLAFVPNPNDFGPIR